MDCVKSQTQLLYQLPPPVYLLNSLTSASRDALVRSVTTATLSASCANIYRELSVSPFVQESDVMSRIAVRAKQMDGQDR